MNRRPSKAFMEKLARAKRLFIRELRDGCVECLSRRDGELCGKCQRIAEKAAGRGEIAGE